MVAISLALLVAVPLNNICSIKCANPACSGRSSFDPAFTQTPIDRAFVVGICSWTIRSPFLQVIVLIISSVILYSINFTIIHVSFYYNERHLFRQLIGLIDLFYAIKKVKPMMFDFTFFVYLLLFCCFFLFFLNDFFT